MLKTNAPPSNRSLLIAILLVLIAGIASSMLTVFSDLVSRNSITILSLTISPMFLLFWLGNAWLINVGARLQGAKSAVVHSLVATARLFPIFIASALVGLTQAIFDRSHNILLININDYLGLINLVVIMGFILAVMQTIQSIYQFPRLNALAAALFPFAVMSFLIFLFILISPLLGSGK